MVVGLSGAECVLWLCWETSPYQKPPWRAPPQIQSHASWKWRLCGAGCISAAPNKQTNHKRYVGFKNSTDGRFLAAHTNLDLKHLALIPCTGPHHIVSWTAGFERCAVKHHNHSTTPLIQFNRLCWHHLTLWVLGRSSLTCPHFLSVEGKNRVIMIWAW